MKKVLILISLITILMTEAAFAASVKVGVIDTGITQKENIFDEGRITEGKNYVSESGDIENKVGHGTRVASLIIGTLDGEIVSPFKESQIVPLVYYSKYPSGVVMNGGIEAIFSAIYDAIDVYGCKVINISSGVPRGDDELKKAIDYAEEKGVLIVSACGNDGESVCYPVAYDTVIGVGSHNDKAEPSDFSCSGQGIDLLFTGENIKTVSIKNSEDYELAEGTSYSAALITSHAAAAFEKYPELLPEQIAAIIYRYAKLKNTVPEGTWETVLDYVDLDDIPDYALEAVEYCKFKNIIQGVTTINFSLKRWQQGRKQPQYCKDFWKVNK